MDTDVTWQLAKKEENIYVSSKEILWLKSGPKKFRCVHDMIKVGLRLEMVCINQYGYSFRTAKVKEILSINNTVDCITIHFKTRFDEYKLYFGSKEYFASEKHFDELSNFFE